MPSAAGSQRTARPRLRPLGVRVLAEPFSANVKVQARLVGTDAHVLGTERLLQRILGHLGQHLGHHLNFAQLLAVEEATSSSRLSSVSGCARVGLFWFRLGSGVLGIWWLVFLCEP